VTIPATSRGITESDVWQAADALLLEGARPTIERVRMKIGRGSPNTVTPYLETWFRSLGARIADPMAFSAPPTLPDPISEAARHFWEAALGAARAEGAAAIEANRAEFAAASRKLDAERAHLRADLERINAQLQAKEEAAQLLRAHLSESQQRVEALSAELVARDRSIVDLRSHVGQIEADRDTLRQHLDAERAVFETRRKEFEAREAAHTERWAAEVDRAREATKVMKTQLTQSEKDFADRLAQMTESLDASEREHRRVTDLHVRSEAAVERLQEASTGDAKMLADLQAKTRELESTYHAQYERVQMQLSHTLAQLAAKDREHGELLRALVAKASRPVRRPRNPPSN
jgi:chromosome segregation ATPase